MEQENIDPGATLIPDGAEVWLALKSDVDARPGGIADMIPSTPDADLEALHWEFSGLIDDKKGIPITPGIEVKPYDAFGHPRFRVKLKKGTLDTGFTALEWNAVTRKIVLPGSAPNKVGIPKDIQIYVLYRFRDEALQRIWATLTPAPAELKSHGGIIDGELSFAELVVHHTADAAGDVFEIVDADTAPTVLTFTFDEDVTSYTVTVDGHATDPIETRTAGALQAYLRALPNIGAGGVSVAGPDGGPLDATFTVAVTSVSAAGTGGDVTVSP